MTHTGVAARPGAAGGVAVLAALEAGPWRLVSLQPLPAQGGFHAAFSGMHPAPWPPSLSVTSLGLCNMPTMCCT